MAIESSGRSEAAGGELCWLGAQAEPQGSRLQQSNVPKESVQMQMKKTIKCSLLFLAVLLTPAVASAQDGIDTGDNAWILTSSALVLMMTGPGLALFYGGLVRKKNILGTMMQSFAMMALMTLLWALYGYSLSFGSGNAFIGGFEYLLMEGVGTEPNDVGTPSWSGSSATWWTTFPCVSQTSIVRGKREAGTWYEYGRWVVCTSRCSPSGDGEAPEKIDGSPTMATDPSRPTRVSCAVE